MEGEIHDLAGRYDQMLAFVRWCLAGCHDRSALDSADIVQSAYASFYRKTGSPGFDRHKGSLVGLLATITRRKVALALRRKNPAPRPAEELAAARDAAAGVERGMSDPEVSAYLRQVVFSLREEFTTGQLLILDRWLDGSRERSRAAVARECGSSLTSVKRTIDQFLDRLARALSADEMTANGTGNETDGGTAGENGA